MLIGFKGILLFVYIKIFTIFTAVKAKKTTKNWAHSQNCFGELGGVGCLKLLANNNIYLFILNFD